MGQHSFLQPLLVTVLAFCLSATVQADDFRGRIVKLQGEVYVLNEHGEQRHPQKTKYLVNTRETVVTRPGAKAVVQFDDGALTVLDEKSRLRVEESGWLSQLGGKVYYIFRKVFGTERPRQVKTNFATIGVRGTTFIVYENEDGQGVALEEGKLNIESPGADYELRQTQQVDDFAAFKQQMQQEAQAQQQAFDDYRSNIEKEFVEYKKAFDLEANRVVSFDGNRVTEAELDATFKSEFADFSNYAQDYIDAYRELDAM